MRIRRMGGVRLSALLGGGGSRAESVEEGRGWDSMEGLDSLDGRTGGAGPPNCFVHDSRSRGRSPAVVGCRTGAGDDDRILARGLKAYAQTRMRAPVYPRSESVFYQGNRMVDASGCGFAPHIHNSKYSSILAFSTHHARGSTGEDATRGLAANVRDQGLRTGFLDAGKLSEKWPEFRHARVWNLRRPHSRSRRYRTLLSDSGPR